jgi:acetyltransferase-like isoleucine patch superfamily enzyme
MIHFWRIVWTVSTFVLVEIIVCGLSAIPAVVLWSQLLRFRPSTPLVRIIIWSGAFIPSYIIFALALVVVSPLIIGVVGWRTPAHAEMQIADVDWPLLNFVRYAAANHLVRVLAGTFFHGSPVWTTHLRLAGARVGRRVYVNSLELNDYNLLEFEDDVVIGADAHLSGHTVEGGIVKTAGMHLGRNTTVGVSSIVEIGVLTGPNCEIGALSFVPKNMKLEADATYAGIPVRRIR